MARVKTDIHLTRLCTNSVQEDWRHAKSKNVLRFLIRYDWANHRHITKYLNNRHITLILGKYSWLYDEDGSYGTTVAITYVSEHVHAWWTCPTNNGKTSGTCKKDITVEVNVAGWALFRSILHNRKTSLLLYRSKIPCRRIQFSTQKQRLTMHMNAPWNFAQVHFQLILHWQKSYVTFLLSTNRQSGVYLVIMRNPQYVC